MAYILRALDGQAGGAVVSQGDKWYFVSVESAWHLMEIEREAAARWWLSGATETSGREFDSLEDLIKFLRNRFMKEMRFDPSAREKRTEISQGISEAANFYVAPKAARFLKLLGCRESDLPSLRSEVLRRFRENGAPWLAKYELDVAIFEWARDVISSKSKADGVVAQGESRYQTLRHSSQVQGLGVIGVSELIDELPRITLRSLALWADRTENHTIEEIATILRIPEGEVQEHLEWAAVSLELPATSLRKNFIAYACQLVLTKKK